MESTPSCSTVSFLRRNSPATRHAARAGTKRQPITRSRARKVHLDVRTSVSRGVFSVGFADAAQLRIRPGATLHSSVDHRPVSGPSTAAAAGVAYGAVRRVRSQPPRDGRDLSLPGLWRVRVRVQPVLSDHDSRAVFALGSTPGALRPCSTAPDV